MNNEQRMTALAYMGQWNLKLIERDIPQIKREEDVLIKVAGSGICGTDLGIASGLYSANQGVILGHEFSGTILETGAAVQNVKIGDRVFVDPTYHCAQCDLCATGRPNHCIEKSHTETGVSADGAFSSHYVTSSRFVVPMAEATSFEAASLAEPFSCALTGVNQVNIRPDDRTIILGGGTMGLMYAHALSLKGVRGTLVDISPQRLAFSERALPFGWKAEKNFKDAIEKIRGKQFDLAVDTTSVMLSPLLEKISRGGKVIMVGLRRGQATIDPAELADKSISVVGSIDSIGTFPLACRMIDEGRLPWKSIVTKTFNLKNYEAAFAELGVDLKKHETNASAQHLKIMLTPDEDVGGLTHE